MMKMYIKKVIIFTCCLCVIFGVKNYATSNDNIYAYNVGDNEKNKVKETVEDIESAIKELDFKKVVSLSDYNGTYDTRYIDEFFAKYDGSKDTVKKLVDTFLVDIKDIEKKDDAYIVSTKIGMVNIDKMSKNIAPKIAFDMLLSNFNKKTINNDIINIVLKRIKEYLMKENVDKIDFDYEVRVVYHNVKKRYVVDSYKIISDVYNKLKPMFNMMNIKVDI